MATAALMPGMRSPLGPVGPPPMITTSNMAAGGSARHCPAVERSRCGPVRCGDVQGAEYDFELPTELIAQDPAESRIGARLLHLGRASGAIAHSTVAALPDLLRAGDVVVVNNTRVFPARLLGRRVPSGGAVECLLIRQLPGP